MTTIDQPAKRVIPTDPNSLLSTAEAAALLGLSPRTLETLRVRGGGPVFVLISRGTVRYRRRVIDAWIAQRRCAVDT